MYEVLTRMCVKSDEKRYLLVNLCSKCMRFLLEVKSDEKRYLLVNLCSKCMRFLLEGVLKEMRNDTYW